MDQQTEARLIQSCNGLWGAVKALQGDLAGLKAAKAAGSGLTPLVPRFIEDIPGKRVPYSYNTNIAISTTAESPGTITISQDGPFLATGIVASWRPTAGGNAGRWRKINSIWALTSDGAAGTYTDADTVDFEWKYQASGSDRNRQNEVLRSSVELFSVHDRPAYLPIADFFERNEAITVNVTMLRTPTNAGILKFQFLGYKLLAPIAFAG